MDKLITNHAYLFIKQGLGEIQRGNTVLTSFNLQSVIKRNTAARLQKRCLVSAFLLVLTDLCSRGHCQPHTGSGHPPFTFRCSRAARDFGQVPCPARTSASSSVKWVRAPLAARVSWRQVRQVTAVPGSGQALCGEGLSSALLLCACPPGTATATEALASPQRPLTGNSFVLCGPGGWHRAQHADPACPARGGTGLLCPIHDPAGQISAGEGDPSSPFALRTEELTGVLDFQD